MVFATGYNFQKPLHEILTYHVWGLLLGVVVSVIVGVKISRLLNLPFSLWPYVPKRLTLKQRYQFMLTKDPTVLVKASHFSSILFVTSYIAYLLIDKGGYWVLISSAAVLSGEHLEHIKKKNNRTCSRNDSRYCDWTRYYPASCQCYLSDFAASPV